MKRRYKKSGFTLVELLVVIAIIASLLAVLMPALQKAKKKAKTMVCGMRQKQIGVGLLAYANSYDGYIMPTALMQDKLGEQLRYYMNSDPRIWSKVNMYWYVNLWDRKYVADADAFFCPDFFPFDYEGHEAWAKLLTAQGVDPVVHFNNTSGEAFTLGMRDWCNAAGEVYRGPKPLAIIPQPARFFLVADSMNPTFKTTRPVQTFRIFSLAAAASANNHPDGVHLRHEGKAGAIFADGHVERRSANYFLAIRNPANWQHKYSKVGANTAPQLTGYRVYDKDNKELAPTSSTPVDAD